jgi:hypothetical protein
MIQKIVWLVTASLAFSLASASGADLSRKIAPSPAAEASDEDTSRFEIDTSVDATSRRSVGGYVGVLVSPFTPLAESGLRLRFEGVNGSYYYNQPGDVTAGEPQLFSVHGHFTGASVLVGYEFVGENFSIAGFTGADYQRNSVNIPVFVPTAAADNFNPTVGTRWGAKFAVDGEWKPIDWASVALTGSYSTANSSWWSRVRPGYRIFEEIYVGPEAGYQGNEFYRQWRVGAHVRGITLGPVELSLATGYMNDSTVHEGVYGTLDASVRF